MFFCSLDSLLFLYYWDYAGFWYFSDCDISYCSLGDFDRFLNLSNPTDVFFTTCGYLWLFKSFFY